MSLEGAIYAKLNDATYGLDTYVGSSTSAKIYPGHIPQGQTLPAVVYNRVGSTWHDHLSGVTGLCEALVQVDCYAASHATAIAMAECVRDSLQGYHGTLDTTVIEYVGEEGRTDDYIPPIDASDVGRWVCSQDYRIIYQFTP